MITVSIFVNGKPIVTRSAKRVKDRCDGRADYKVDDGMTILHKVKDGAIPLAIKMLEGVERL